MLPQHSPQKCFHMLNALFSLRVCVCLCFSNTADVAFPSTTYQPLSKKFKSSKKFFFFFSLYFQRFLDSVLIFNVAANLVCLNVVWKATKITGYNITRKTAPKYFQQYSKSNFLTTTRWPLCHCTKKYNTNYRHLLQNNIAQRNQRWSFHPFRFEKPIKTHSKNIVNWQHKNKQFPPFLCLHYLC